ncbi:MAG: tetratricopeptide repeat protein, partial [Gammaproteobacteria bacterium]|nr:tetratricopeptide repeat protein [Gammaproteobacteria bacterium]
MACGDKGNVSSEGRFQRAKVHLQEKAYSNGIIELKNILQKKPEDVDARFLLGKFYLAIGDGAAAEKELVKAGQSGIRKKDVNILLVNSLLLQRKYKSALEILQGDKSIQETNAIAYDALVGTVYLGMRRIDEARQLFKSVLKRQSDNYQAHLGNIDVLLIGGDYADARTHARKFLESHPNDLQGNLRLGESAFALKDYKSAAKAYKASLAMKEAKIFTPKV